MIDQIVCRHPNAHHCYVCGTQQDEGLHVEFYELKSKRLLTIYHPVHAHQGYPKVLHGGIAASLLDEGMARVYQIFHQDPWGMTIDLNIRYLKQMPMDETLYVISELTKDRSRMYEVKGYITNGKEIYAKATASYIKVYVYEQLKSLGYEILENNLPFHEIELPE